MDPRAPKRCIARGDAGPVRERPGPRRSPSPPEDPAKARNDRRQRARDEALDVQERADRSYRSFEVRNPVHGTHYRVLGPEIPGILLCPCPDFGRRDVGTCKHVEAVLVYLKDAPPAPPLPGPAETEERWARIEGTIERYRGRPLTTLCPLWEAGRLLQGAPGP